MFYFINKLKIKNSKVVMANVEKSNILKNKISKELRAKANDFLNNKVKANNLVDILQYLQVCNNFGYKI